MPIIDPTFYVHMQHLLSRADGAYGRYDDYCRALDRPAVRGLRCNGAKTDGDTLRALFPYPLTPTPFCEGGFYLPPACDKPGLTAAHAAGLFYVQEPSATAAVAALLPYLPPAAQVLDLCAAPGGKATQLAAALRGEGFLLANEYVFARAKILLGNIERMGVRNAAVTCHRPDEIAAALPQHFDAVLADVPCSGEGMLRKEREAAQNWSKDNVQACVARAREILASALRCLKVGGVLAFSTCTLNAEENEEQVRHLCDEYGCLVLPPPAHLQAVCCGGLPPVTDALRVFPHLHGGEGHFVCLLRKTRPDDALPVRRKPSRKATDGAAGPADARAFWRLFASMTDEPPFGTVCRTGDTLSLQSDALPDLSGLNVLRAGVRAADLTGGRLIPHHHLALALGRDRRSPLSLDADDARIADYLAGREISLPDAPEGWQVVRLHGYPLGLTKVSGGRGKNHYPKGLRFL